MPLTLLAVLAALTWLVVLLHPARPWRNLHLLPALGGEDHELGDVTVLIPARDEAETLPATLAALARQGRGLAVVVVDDESRDGTAEVGRRAPVARVRVVQGRPPPSGWSGKVWAQHQGEPYLDRPLTLLLDADVALAPGMVAALKARLAQDGAALVSIMARLRAASGVEKLLVPPFIHFFKLLYPFALSNDPRLRVAAAAGGCVLLRTEALRAAGGFAAIHDAVIDDCALARRIQSLGGRTWIGQSADVNSHRRYRTLAPLWNMVARTAYCQLRYSAPMLLACTAAMLVLFVVPPLAIAAGGAAAVAGAAALALMALAFAPTVLFLELAPAWTLTLPLAAVLYLLMTWTSALRYWRGERTAWRGRRYPRVAADGGSPCARP